MKTVLELEDLANRAIKAALSQDWATAVQLNQEYLTEDPRSIEAGNRLGRAYQESNQIDLARQAFQNVLQIDPYNTIAQKNLDKLSSSNKKTVRPQLTSQTFLEEPGKTRTAFLEQVNNKLLKQLATGQELELRNHKGLLSVFDHKDTLVGHLDENLSNHLIKLIALGNTYSVHFMQPQDDQVQVFLRETYQSIAASKYVSFAKVPSKLSHLGSIGTRRLTEDSDDHPVVTNDEEEIDNWDAETPDESGISDDEFASVSLEQMREDEDEGFGNDY